MPKHTPGPWHIYEDEGGKAWRYDDGYHVVADDGGFVARVIDLPGTGLDPETLTANAKLMAEAPRLLELLRAARRHCPWAGSLAQSTCCVR